MNPPDSRYGDPPPKPWFKVAAISLAVFALVSMTVVVLAAVVFAMGMRGWGNNK